MSLFRSIADQMRSRAFFFPSTPPLFFSNPRYSGPVSRYSQPAYSLEKKENKVGVTWHAR